MCLKCGTDFLFNEHLRVPFCAEIWPIGSYRRTVHQLWVVSDLAVDLHVVHHNNGVHAGHQQRCHGNDVPANRRRIGQSLSSLNGSCKNCFRACSTVKVYVKLIGLSNQSNYQSNALYVLI